MPSASKVMIVSIVACGASREEMDVILGAKTVVRRLEMRRGCHVTVIESGKLLLRVNGICSRKEASVPIFDDADVVFGANAELEAAFDQFLLANVAQAVGIACDMGSGRSSY